jgi:hypothetical protein
MILEIWKYKWGNMKKQNLFERCKNVEGDTTRNMTRLVALCLRAVSVDFKGAVLSLWLSDWYVTLLQSSPPLHSIFTVQWDQDMHTHTHTHTSIDSKIFECCSPHYIVARLTVRHKFCYKYGDLTNKWADVIFLFSWWDKIYKYTVYLLLLLLLLFNVLCQSVNMPAVLISKWRETLSWHCLNVCVWTTSCFGRLYLVQGTFDY